MDERGRTVRVGMNCERDRSRKLEMVERGRPMDKYVAFEGRELGKQEKQTSPVDLN